MKKKLFIILAFIIILPFVTSCKETETQKGDNDSMQKVVQIEMESGGKIIIELYPNIAPLTVANFEKLVSAGFYNGLIFHRVIKGFMIQGGDPEGTGMGGSKETIKGEFSANGVTNNLKHTRGVISMARSQSYNSASSQFFIMHADNKGLDGQYAAFGKVIEGMDVVDQIANVKVDGNDKPITPQIIKSITILENYKANSK